VLFLFWQDFSSLYGNEKYVFVAMFPQGMYGKLETDKSSKKIHFRPVRGRQFPDRGQYSGFAG
jgi:hypothetical protein